MVQKMLSVLFRELELIKVFKLAILIWTEAQGLFL